jgi:retron-type reverse transcriptase
MKGNMTGARIPENISPQLHDIAEKAASHPEMSFNNISHRINTDLLHEAYRQTRKDGASGVDGVTAEEYAADLGENLRNLHERLKTGSYKAPRSEGHGLIRKGESSAPQAFRPLRIKSCKEPWSWC